MPKCPFHLPVTGCFRLFVNLEEIRVNDTGAFKKNFLSKSIYNITPKVGDLILFPNYLMHTAYPFVVDGERRSFSFNVELDKKVADVFHD